jgi:hypothetical protein
MALGLSAAEANAFLDAHVAEFPWIKLHTGDPGSAGTANAAGNDTRKQPTWASASGGAITTSAAIDWSDAEVDTSEDYTHYSLWTASTGGTFGSSGAITANAVSDTGDAFTIPAGDLDITISTAA